MTSMSFAGTAWFGLVVGLALFAEAAFFLISGRLKRRGGDGGRRPRDRQIPMLLCMGVMFTATSAARLAGWTGTGETAVFLIGIAAALATMGFAIRSLVAATGDRRSGTLNSGSLNFGPANPGPVNSGPVNPGAPNSESPNV